MFDKIKIFAGFSAMAVTLILGLKAPDAKAAAISMGSSFGVGATTRIASSGLEWLILTESPRLSVNQTQVLSDMDGSQAILTVDTAEES